LKLHEYQSKRVFAESGIPIPRGEVALTATEARDIAKRLGGRVVIKSQVLVGGRGKAGGIRVANSSSDAETLADQILGMEIKGLPVRVILVEEAASITDELYLGLVIDRAQQRVVMMGSSEGGVDIEEVASKTPDRIIKISIHPCIGLRDYQARELAVGMGLDRDLIRPFVRIAKGLYDAFCAGDASLAEINPLVVTGDGSNGRGDPPLLAVDGKMVLDDNALFRHRHLAEMRNIEEETMEERDARGHGLSYVKLDGNIGCMVNGAGLAMATMDIIKLFGGYPANFLDIGGGAKADKVAAALRIILTDSSVEAVLFNIFGGITRCDEVAKGILSALDQVETEVPMVARLVGTNQEEGREILSSANMPTAATLAEAAQKAVAAARS